MIEGNKRSIEAIVLAGGYGSRMGEISRDRQKCLLPIDGKPALFHIIDNMVEAFGSVDMKIAVAYKADQVKEEVDRYINRKTTTITYVPHKEGSESGGAYRTLVPHVNGSTLVITPGDIIAQSKAYADVVTLFEERKTAFAISLSPDLDQVDSHSIGKVENGLLVAHQFPPLNPVPEGYHRDMTMYGTDRKFFDLVEKYGASGKMFSASICEVIQEMPIAANVYQGQWVHIGYPQDLQKTMV